jgi:hypothetical protein
LFERLCRRGHGGQHVRPPAREGQNHR